MTYDIVGDCQGTIANESLTVNP